MASMDVKAVETILANNAFVHGYSSTADIDLVQLTLSGQDPAKFNGIVIDTVCTRRSIMSISKYRAYQKNFGRRVPMRPARKNVKGIGEKSIAIG